MTTATNFIGGMGAQLSQGGGDAPGHPLEPPLQLEAAQRHLREAAVRRVYIVCHKVGTTAFAINPDQPQNNVVEHCLLLSNHSLSIEFHEYSTVTNDCMYRCLHDSGGVGCTGKVVAVFLEGRHKPPTSSLCARWNC